MSQKPPRCHYDHTLGARVTGEHRDDCEHPDTHRGCVPCTAPHCRICGRAHATNAEPMTCGECVGKTRQDLVDIAAACRQLRPQAIDAGANGRLAAAARIPGATAMVLIGPSVDPDTVLVSRHWADDHRHADTIPPLAVLAWWEDTWRGWLGHTPAARASIGGAIGYLDTQLAHLAQTNPETGGPDYTDFARSLVELRISLEHALHDEREPERGVECFECGTRLVRRHHDRRPCRHKTPARVELERWLTLGYPEALAPADVRAARQPCGRPGCDQGGITDPRAGLSWECPACRKEYDPGEYATAVRRSLLDVDAQGWTDITMAAEAATTLTGRTIAASTVRKWMDRGQVSAMCVWSYSAPEAQVVPETGAPEEFAAVLARFAGRLRAQRWGQRVVLWEDVAARVTRAASYGFGSGRAS